MQEEREAINIFSNPLSVEECHSRPQMKKNIPLTFFSVLQHCIFCTYDVFEFIKLPFVKERKSFLTHMYIYSLSLFRL